MVSFRFHLVSLTAVFLALALGIALGATVIDRSLVDTLDRRVTDVENRAKQADAAAADARTKVNELQGYSDQSADLLVADRLTGVPVLFVGVRGMPDGPVKDLAQSVTAAGADYQGTIWFRDKMRLDNPADVTTLAGIVDTPSIQPDTVRRATVDRLAQLWTASRGASLMAQLQQSSFIDFDAPPKDDAGNATTLADVPRAGTRFVIVSDADPDVPNAELAEPLAAELATNLSNIDADRVRVLAAEPLRDVQGKPTRATFVGPLRKNGSVNQALSTVDDLEETRGRVAAVLALAAGADGQAGHFGLGPGADRQVPELADVTPSTTTSTTSTTRP